MAARQPQGFEAELRQRLVEQRDGGSRVAEIEHGHAGPCQSLGQAPVQGVAVCRRITAEFDCDDSEADRLVSGIGTDVFQAGFSALKRQDRAAAELFAQEAMEVVQVTEISTGMGLAIIGAGIPTGLSTIGAGIAVGPIGAASFNNEFGRPNLAGYFRTFEQELGGEAWGYHKPIMIAGGMGTIREPGAQHQQPSGRQTAGEVIEDVEATGTVEIDQYVLTVDQVHRRQRRAGDVELTPLNTPAVQPVQETALARASEAVLLHLSYKEDTVHALEDTLLHDYGFPLQGPALRGVAESRSDERSRQVVDP